MRVAGFLEAAEHLLGMVAQPPVRHDQRVVDIEEHVQTSMLGHGASFTAAAAPSGALPGPVCRDTRASITRGSLRLDSLRPAPSPFRLPLPLRERAGVRGSDARGATSLRGRARVSCGGRKPPTPPSRTSTLRGSGPPTHPPAPTPPSGSAAGTQPEGDRPPAVGAKPPRPRPDRQPEHSPRVIARPLWGRSPHAPARIGSRNTARGRSPARWGRSPHAPVRIGSRNTARGRSPARCGGSAPTPPPGSPADRRETVRRPLPSRERAGGEGRRAPARPARAGDDRRTRWLESRGCGVLRFWNDDVLLRLPPVLEAIAVELREPPPESPSP